jgi:signal transduction histidine kinase
MAERRSRARDASDTRLVAFAAVAAIVLALVEIGVDVATWIELDIAPLYALPLILAAVTRSRPLLWSLLAASVFTTFLVYAQQAPPGSFGLGDPLLVNRVLDAAALLVTAGLLHIWLASLDVRAAQARRLEQQNAELAAANAALADANAKLGAREVELAQRNAALDELRRVAEASSGRKTELLAAVSHDIRSPVNAINLIATYIRRAADDPASSQQVPRMAERLQANTSSLLELVSDVLDMAQLDSGEVKCRPVTFRLDDLVADRCRTEAPQAEAKGLALSHTVATPMIVHTDRSKLDRMLTNLVTNAIKYTPAGSVSVTTGLDPGGRPQLEVRDTGPGILPEDRDRIFNEFTRGSLVHADGQHGWGMGLAICRRLARLLGAAVEVDSEPARGSTFRIVLPASARVVDGGDARRSGDADLLPSADPRPPRSTPAVRRL